MRKIWAICSGSDWFDAGIDHVILPDGMNLEQEQREREQAITNYHNRGRTGNWPGTFVEWLVNKGATEPSDDILEEYWKD